MRTSALEPFEEAIHAPGYLVKGSPGQGGWAEVVWVAIFDRLVTTTAREGFYVVWLFSPDGAAVSLVLQQAMTSVLEEAGSDYLSELESRCRSKAALLGMEALDGLTLGPIDLAATTRRAKGYEAGSIASLRM